MTGRLKTLLNSQPVDIEATGQMVTLRFDKGVPSGLKKFTPLAAKLVHLLNGVNIETKLILFDRFPFRLTPRRVRFLRLLALR